MHGVGGIRGSLPGRLALALTVLAAVTALMASCTGATDSAQGQAIARGQVVYQTDCQGCHEGQPPDLARQPPSLDGLFDGAQLPDGSPTTDANVRQAILRGGVAMPPFAGRLGADDLNDLLQYLHTR